MSMTRKTYHGYDRRRRPFEALRAVLASATRYDLALWAIPTAFLVALAVGSLLGLPRHAALVGAALLGVFVLVDVIALNPPVGPTS